MRDFILENFRDASSCHPGVWPNSEQDVSSEEEENDDEDDTEKPLTTMSVESAKSAIKREEADEDVVRLEQARRRRQRSLPSSPPLTTSPKQTTSKSPSTLNSSSSSKKPARSTNEARYFKANISVICFNCGEVGHMSSGCLNPKTEKTCSYCAETGHELHQCPNLRCSRCLEKGHRAKDCPNERWDRGACDICGSTAHRRRECRILYDDFHGIFCMACGKPGHSCCITDPPVRKTMYCPNCAGEHLIQDCNVPLSEIATRHVGRRRYKNYC